MHVVGVGGTEVPRFIDGIILVAAILICGLLSVRSGKDVNWDLFNYHFYNGWAALTAHSFTNIAPAQLQSFLNPALDISQYLMIAYLPPRMAGFILGAIQGINVFLVFAIMRDLGRLNRTCSDMAIAVVAAGAALSGPAAASELGSTMGDLTLTVPILLGVLLIVQAFRIEDKRRAARKIIAAGVCLGATAGIKYITGPYAIAAAGALVIRPPPSLSRVSTILRLFVAGTAAFLATAGPWMIALDVHYGNPMFPFFNGWFHSPYMADLTWSDTEFGFKSLSALLRFPLAPIHQGAEHLQYPFRSLGLPLGAYCLVLSIFLGLVSYLRSGRIGSRAQRLTPAAALLPAEWWLLLYFGLSYLFWAKTFGDYRYFLSSEVLIPAIIVITVCQVARRRTIRLAAVAAVALVMVMFVSAPSWGRLPWRNGTYFGVVLPPDAVTKGTMVLMTGIQGTAFVIPSFGYDIRFVRVQSNFSGLESPKYTQMVSRTIAAQRGPLALLTTADALSASSAVIRQYDLEIVTRSCVPVQSVFSLPIEICRLLRN